MEKHLILNSIPDSFKTKVIGEGTTSTCYLTDDSLIYKEYTNIAPNYNMLDRISRFNTECFIFPKSFIYIDRKCYDNFKGYLMEYFNGKRLSEIDKCIDVNTLIKELIKLENDIEYLSKNKVMLEDLNSNNILVNSNGIIKVVDPDYFWITNYLKDIKQILKINLSTSAQYIVSPLLKCSNLSFIDSNLLSLKQACFLGYERVSKLLIEIIELLEKHGISCDNVGELQNNIKVLKRVNNNEQSL